MADPLLLDLLQGFLATPSSAETGTTRDIRRPTTLTTTSSWCLSRTSKRSKLTNQVTTSANPRWCSTHFTRKQWRAMNKSTLRNHRKPSRSRTLCLFLMMMTMESPVECEYFLIGQILYNTLVDFIIID